MFLYVILNLTARMAREDLRIKGENKGENNEDSWLEVIKLII